MGLSPERLTEEEEESKRRSRRRTGIRRRKRNIISLNNHSCLEKKEDLETKLTRDVFLPVMALSLGCR